MNFFKKKRRGLVYLAWEGSGLLNKHEKGDGYQEVIIEEETGDLYKVRFLNPRFSDETQFAQWREKMTVRLLDS